MSSTSISCTTPPNVAGPASVSVANAGGASAANLLFTYVTLTATQSVASKVLTQNYSTTSFTPVTGGGGTTPLTYSVSPTLPAGLSMSSSTGAITGTPTVASVATNYTVTVTDANGASATAAFSLTVNPAVTATQAVATTVLTQNHATTSFTPVTGGGGTTPLSYSVSPTLPAGLTMSASTGTITGTPTVTSSATTYTVTVTDANGETANASFSLTVNTAVTATQSVASTALTQNRAATSFTPIAGGGGTSPLSYSVSPTLPAGLSISASTGAITGTPTGTSTATTYTVTVADANGETSTATFSLIVNSAVTATQAVASTVLAQNSAATAFTPVAGGGGAAPLTYSVAPSLPAGLSLSSSTGAVTGTPTVASSLTNFTVTVTDANGETATAPFGVVVVKTIHADPTSGLAVISVTGSNPCGFADVQFVETTTVGGNLPADYVPMAKALQFNTTNCGTGAVANMTLTLAQPVRPETVLYKFGPATPGATTSTWFPVLGATLSADRLTFHYSVADNGIGDSDPTVGVINDPVVPLIPASILISSVPTLTEYGLLLLLGVVGLLGTFLVLRRGDCWPK